MRPFKRPVKTTCRNGPRCLFVSSWEDAVLIGGDEGTVDQLSLTSLEDEASPLVMVGPLPDDRTDGIRCLLPITEIDKTLPKGWLLYGTTSGNVYLWQYRDGEIPIQEKPTNLKLLHKGEASSTERNPVTFIDPWDENGTSVLISWRLSPAKIVKFKKANATPPLEVETVSELSVTAVIGMVRSTNKVLCIADAGALSLWDINSRELLKSNLQVWGKRWPPNIVTDFSLSKDGKEGTYLATDAGVFLISPLDHPEIHAELVDLPGFYGPAASVSRRRWQGTDLLWATDLKGNVFSFKKEADEELWKPLRFHQESSRVALSTAEEAVNGSLVVVHVCRTHEVIATVYPKNDLESEQPNSLQPLKNSDNLHLEPPTGGGIYSNPLIREHWNQWPPMVQYTAHVEAAVLAEIKAKEQGFLPEFLSDKDTVAAATARLVTTESFPRMRHDLLLCLDTLIACINRRSGEDSELNTALSLALIRWLKQLQKSIIENGLKKNKPSREVELNRLFIVAVQRVRKWSLFGNAYRQQEDLRSPLHALVKQGEKHKGLYQLEYFVYRAMLFARHISTDSKELVTPGDPSIPLDLAISIPRGSTTSDVVFLATSWGDRSILVHRVKKSGENWDLHTPRWYFKNWKKATSRHVLYPMTNSTVAPMGWRSRSLLLLEDTSASAESALLLDAPAHAGSRDELENLRLTRFIFSRNGEEGVCEYVSHKPLGLGESVFCLRDLGNRLIFVGLAGRRGSPEFKLIRISEKLRIETLRGALVRSQKDLHSDESSPTSPVIRLTAAYPELDESERNPIWSSALIDTRGKGGFLKVIIGCGDGQILSLELNITGEFFKCRPTQVGRLGTPVRALECRETEAGGLRVFAGGQDGTLIAYESLLSTNADDFESLWATREESPIVRLHPVTLLDGKESAIVAGTRSGRTILMSDVERVTPRPGTQEESDSDPRRLRIPGERLGRFHLNETMFASQVLPSTLEASLQDVSNTPFACLAIATGTGVLKIVTLHIPKHTPARHKEFRKLESLLQAIADDGLLGGSLRLTDALTAAVPPLTAAATRRLLPDDDSSGSPPPFKLPAPHLVPWHLQPLLLLGRILESLSKNVPISGPELRESLRQALDNAHIFRDFLLFKEIVRSTLQLANKLLFAHCKDTSADISWYTDLAACLTDVRSLWIGDITNVNLRTRIVIVKSWSAPYAYLALSNLLRAKHKGVEGAIKSHARLLHEFFAPGDSLLSLETLRAVSVALTKVRYSLDRDEELEENLLRRLFQAIGAFASRSVHGTQGEHGPAVAHEIARLYALGLHCAPSAALSLTHRMSEADLPRDVGSRVLQQFRLLESSLYAHDSPPNLDRVVTILEVGFGLKPPEDRNKPYFLSERPEYQGAENNINSEYIDEGKEFDKIQRWLWKNTDLLRRNPENVNLGRLLTIWTKLKDTSKLEFRHSSTFWSDAFSDLFEKRRLRMPDIDYYGDPTESDDTANEEEDVSVEGLIPNQIQPELVLQSSTLVKWSNDQIKRLGEMKQAYEIFDPQRRLYEEALQSFADAANSLRSGAALQRNIVLGVLGHGLLENLGYHLLALWEIAQTIDPFMTWKWPRENPNDRSSSRNLATTVLSASDKAAGVIRTLRNIQTLLTQSSEGDIERTVAEIFGIEEVSPWLAYLTESDKSLRWETSERALAALQFSFRELRANQIEHGKGITKVVFIMEGRKEPRFTLVFPINPEKAKDRELIQRLEKIERIGLEQPVGPDPRSDGRSHGFGLYLSRLALASVGWDFRMKFDIEAWELRFVFSDKEPRKEYSHEA